MHTAAYSTPPNGSHTAASPCALWHERNEAEKMYNFMNTRLSCMKTLLLCTAQWCMTMGRRRRMRRTNKSYLHSQPICICAFICDVWFSLGQQFKCNPTHFSPSSSSPSPSTSSTSAECLLLVLCHRALRNWTQDHTPIYIFHVWPLDYYVLSAAHKLSVCCEKKIVVPSVDGTRRHNFCRRIVQHEFICRRSPCAQPHTVWSPRVCHFIFPIN